MNQNALDRINIRRRFVFLKSRLEYFLEYCVDSRTLSNWHLMVLMRKVFINDHVLISLQPDGNVEIKNEDGLIINIGLTWNLINN